MIGVYMKFLKSKKILISICAAVLVAAIVIAAVVIGNRPVQIKNYSFIAADQAYVKYGDSFDISIDGSGSRKLMVNSSNGAVALVSSDGSTVFNSCSEDASEYSLATVLSVRLRDENGNTYTMNSTDNSVAFKTFKVDSKSDNRISLNFNIFPDSDRAKKGVDGADIFASVTLALGFENGAFKASVDAGSVQLPDGFCLEKISILPGLFSVSYGVSGDYYTVPDGCGALVQLNSVNKSDYSLNLGVYGTDTAFYSYSQGAYLPYFAYIRNGCLVNTIITEGDALSEISFKKFARGGGYLYNTFTVTACGVTDGKYVQGPSYKGRITQIYNFTEDAADYNEVAFQVRDNLIRRGFLSDTLNDTLTEMPAYINVIGSEDGSSAVTTFDQAAEIATILKSKGIGNIAIRFSGGGKNGLLSVASDSLNFPSSLGCKSGVEALGKKLSEQGNALYMDYNMSVCKADYSKTTVALYSDTSKYAGFNSGDFSLLGRADVNKNISKAYKYLADTENVNICLNDGSYILYTDIEDKVNRQVLLSGVRDNLNSLKTNSRVMLSSPAVYLMKYADGVFSVPEASSLQNYNGVTPVPVLQMVLHGSICYGTNPINVSALSSQDALLKAVEYGAVPSFLFTHSELESLGYSAYVNETATLYKSVSEILPLMGMTMTSHEIAVPGVYKVIYDYSRIVYVNYNPSVVEVDGIMIPAKDFVVI